MKVLLINNYSMEVAYNLWKNGTSGSHHIWGKIELEKKREIEMVIFPHVKYKFLNKIGKFIGIGHLDQQIRVLGKLNEFDILYAPYGSANTKLLLLLKWFRLFNKPIVATIHQPFLGTKSKKRWQKVLAKQFILQYDAAIFLSEPLMKETIAILKLSPERIAGKFSTAQWGPDINFYKEFNKVPVEFKDCAYVISAGHTDRDYETLIEAFREINFPLHIYCTPSSIPQIENIPDHVKVYSETIPYVELLKYYKKALAILVPLKYPVNKEGCQGMTSLQDVVAVSKPVVMTRNKNLNLDIEKEGIGYGVDMYDVEGWRNVIHQLLADESGWNAMSQNAQRVYKEKFNSVVFAERLEKVFFDVYNG